MHILPLTPDKTVFWYENNFCLGGDSVSWPDSDIICMAGKLLLQSRLEFMSSSATKAVCLLSPREHVVLQSEDHNTRGVCASCREYTSLLPAWLKLDHQMASLHLSRHLIKSLCLWSILSRITALVWSGINIWFPLLSCIPFNIYFSLQVVVQSGYKCGWYKSYAGKGGVAWVKANSVWL